MAEVVYADIPDTQRQHIKDTVANVREMNTPTLNSFKKSTKKVMGGQRGYQVPFFKSDYGQNSYLTPGSAGNSYVQPIAPKTTSMWIGLSYQACVFNEDGILLGDLTQKESIINAAKLRELRIENFMKHQNYYAIGAGNGVLAVVSSVTGGTFTGTTAAQTTPGYTKGAHRLIEGVTYDIIDESSFAVVGTITPTANGTNSATVTCTSTGLPNNSGAFVVEQGAYNKVPRGLGYLIDYNDRIFQGVNTAGVTEFNSSVVDLNGSALTSATINTLKTRVQIRMNVDSKSKEGGRLGHITPGQYTALANQGYSARQYQAANGQANTSYGYPEAYVDGDIIWVVDADLDEDRVYLRRSADYLMFEQKAFGPVNRDGLTVRQAPGQNDVGANSWFGQYDHVYNLGFDGGASGGNYGSAYVMRAAVTAGTSQVTAISG